MNVKTYLEPAYKAGHTDPESILEYIEVEDRADFLDRALSYLKSGEIAFINGLLAPRMSPEDVMNSWTGHWNWFDNIKVDGAPEKFLVEVAMRQYTYGQWEFEQDEEFSESQSEIDEYENQCMNRRVV